MKSLRSIVMLFLFFTGASALMAQTATVTTDKLDYQPGEYVIVTGWGWTPGEVVEFHFDETPKPATCINSHDRTVMADSSGNIFYNQFLIRESHLGVSFVLTAIGQTSGLTAITEFTDGSISITPNPACGIGGSASITLSITGGGNIDVTKPMLLYKGTAIPANLIHTFTASNLVYVIPSVTLSDAGLYTYTATRTNGNPDTGTATLTINIVSNNTISADQTVCSGAAPAQLTGSDATATTGNISYRWMRSTDGINFTDIGGGSADDQDYAPGALSVTTWYQRRATSSTAGSCSSLSNIVKITVSSPSSATISAGSSTSFCVGGSVLLSSSASSGNQWYKDGSLLSGETNQTYTATTSGDYTVIVTSNGCSSPASIATVVTVSPLPTASIDDNSQNQTGICFGSSPSMQLTGTDDARVYYKINDGSELFVDLNSGGQGAITINTMSVNSTVLLTRVILNGCESTLSETGTFTLETIAPTITCPANISVNGTSAAGAVVTYADPVVADNCGVATTELIAGFASGETFPLGETIVTYRVTDTSGNTAECSFTVEVTGVPPSIQCPSDISVSTAAGLCSANVTFAATETTGIPASTIAYTIDDTPVTSGSSFPVGTTLVTATATNALGTSSCSFNVTVSDDEEPTVVTQNITINLDGNGVAGVEPDEIDNNSTDNCAIDSYSLSKTSFDCSNVGSNTVTLTVTDVNGNSASATAVVTVVDNLAPTVATQNITINLDENGIAGVEPDEIDFNSSDNCAIASISLSKESFDCSNVGPNTVTLTVTDVNGNSATATAVVTVVDNIAPIVHTQNITINLDGNGVAGVEPDEIDNNSTDNCAIASISLDKESFDCTNVGPNTVTLTVTDVNGNSATATAVVTVEDNVAPVATAQDITVQLDATGNVSIAAGDVNDGSSDACGIASLALSKTSFNCSNVGPNTVTLTVTDVNGNVSTATAVITVEDKIAPTVLTQNVTIYIGMSGIASVTAAQINNGSTDNCEIATYVLSKTSFDCSNVGSNTVSLTVTDVNGNVATGTATVTVVNIAPVINSVASSDADGLFQINTSVTLSINYSDTNVTSATITWDDGNVQTITNPANAFDVPHTYTLAGVYSVKVRVTDVCGLYVEYLLEYLVAYDPSGGFVTGGGWIDSPAGASVQYPDAVGKANFGFVSKYQKGANTPTGNTEFQFKAGNLNFSSTSYQWLVVAGYKAQYKGVGTINGSGSYSFIITAIDGAKTSPASSDKFRIKITNGSSVVYDNQMGQSEDSEASTVIAGGSIVIHDSKSGKRDSEPEEVIAAEIPETSLSVYPNPVEEVIHVRFTSDSKTPVGMQLIDLQGRSLKMETFQSNADGDYEMPVSNLNMNTGFYLLRIAQDKSTKTVKIFKK